MTFVPGDMPLTLDGLRAQRDAFAAEITDVRAHLAAVAPAVATLGASSYHHNGRSSQDLLRVVFDVAKAEAQHALFARLVDRYEPPNSWQKPVQFSVRDLGQHAVLLMLNEHREPQGGNLRDHGDVQAIARHETIRTLVHFVNTHFAAQEG